MRYMLVFAFSAALLSALDNGLAPVPYMGWNTWYAKEGFGWADFTLSDLKAEADALVNTGLRDAGYNILWLDAGWAQSRDTDGSVIPKFSIPELAAYCHTRNLKLGLYTDTGPVNYVGGPGSQGYIQADMDQMAAWECDAVKVDICGGTGGFPTFKQAFEAFRDAINSRMIYNICAQGNVEQQWTWGPQTGHSFRTSGDISAGYLGNLDANMAHPEATGPGAYNDPDYMNGVLGPVGNKSQFSMWAMMASPLMLGFRMSQADSALLNIYKNMEVIALGLDSLCYQCRQVAGNEHVAIYKKDLKDGNIAVALLNRDNTQGWHQPGAHQTDSFSAVTGSKIRLFFTSTQGDSHGWGRCPEISEFEVYNGTSTENLALNKPASASSQYNTAYSADKANDGNASTSWCAAATAGNGEWIEIDFGINTTFDKVVWIPTYDRINNYTVQYWTGSGWADAVPAANWDSAGGTADIIVNWSELGITGNFKVRDLWEHADKGTFSSAYTARDVPLLGCTLIKIFTSSETGTESRLPPDKTMSLEAFPNPFNPSVTIALAGERMKEASVKVFDLSGRLVADLTDKMNDGRAVWNAGGKSSGLYVVTVRQGKRSITKRIVYSK